MYGIYEGDEPEPEQDLADIAADNGVSLKALRRALRESHRDASMFEVIGRAADIDTDWKLTGADMLREAGQ